MHRLSRRGNRRLNHAIHMAAVTQIRYPHSDGRAYYDKKLAEGKTAKKTTPAPKRQVSDALDKTSDAAALVARATGKRTGSPAWLHPTEIYSSSASHLALPQPYDQRRRDHAHPRGGAARRAGGPGRAASAPGAVVLTKSAERPTPEVMGRSL